MIFNTNLPASGGSSEWTELNFSAIFDASMLTYVEGTYLTNGQLVYVSIDYSEQLGDFTMTGGGRYAHSCTAFGTGLTDSGTPCTVVLFSDDYYLYAYYPDGTEVEQGENIRFTIIYPIAGS